MEVEANEYVVYMFFIGCNLDAHNPHSHHMTRVRVRIHAKKRLGGSLASGAWETRSTIERARVYPKFYGKILEKKVVNNTRVQLGNKLNLYFDHKELLLSSARDQSKRGSYNLGFCW